MFKGNKKIISKWYIVSFGVIFLGVIMGALYYTYSFFNASEVKNYLDGYLNTLRQGMNFQSVIKTSIKSYLIIFILITISGFFKWGKFLSFFILIRKGFISAFTTSALINTYGIGGVALSLSYILQITILIPILAVFTSMAIFTSENKAKLEKRDKIIYIIFCVVVFTIFCGCAVFEGILSTTFMKWVAYKVT